MKQLVPIAAGAALLALPQPAAARIVSNTVAPVAERSQQDRRAEVGVQLGCDRAQRARLRVSVTQTSGAYARGRRWAGCTTDRQTFAVKAGSRRNIRLKAGMATVCVVALTRDDARQWCEDITLE